MQEKYISKQQMSMAVQGISSVESKKQLLDKLVADGYTVEGYNDNPKSFVQEVAQGIASGPLQLASNIRGVVDAGKSLVQNYQEYKQNKGDTGATGLDNLASDLVANKDIVKQGLAQPMTKQTYDYGYLGEQSNITTPKEAVGTALNIASNFAGAGALANTSKTIGGNLLARTVPRLYEVAKNITAPATLAGGMYGAGDALSQNKTMGEVAQSAAGGAIGGAIGGTLLAGVPAVGKYVANKVRPTQEVINSQIDNAIRDIYKNTTGDIKAIEASAFKVKKGLDLLAKESPNIKIPDTTKPLGAKDAFKAFDSSKSTPNEFISAVNELGNTIASRARSATEDASKKGVKLDIEEAQQAIINAYNKGELGEQAAAKLQKQLDSLSNDPLAIHDWVQSINSKFGKRYQAGTIDDTATSKLANDIAENLRAKLDTVVDRKGYAEAFGNNQELKRMLVTIAKKANKDVNWGDVSSDAGVDAAFSMLTGNPAYMARTFATSMFKGAFNKIRNKSSFVDLKKATTLSPKAGGQAKMVSNEVKPAAVAPKDALALPSPSYIPMKEAKSASTPKMTVTNALEDPRTKPRIAWETDDLGNIIQTDTVTGDKQINDYLTSLYKKEGVTEQLDNIQNGLPYKDMQTFTEYRQSLFNGNLDIAKKLYLADKNSKDGLQELIQGASVSKSKIAKEVDSYAELLGYGDRQYNNGVDSYDFLQQVVDTYAKELENYKYYQQKIKGLKREIKQSKSFNEAAVPKTARLVSDEAYQKASKSLKSKLGSINSGVRVDALPDMVVVAAYHIENGVKSAVELGERLAKEGYKLTKEQIDNLFNSANLTNEAKKYKSAEEFVNKNITSKFKQNDSNVLEIPGAVRLTHTSPEQHIKDFSIQKMNSETMDRNFGDYFYVSNSTIPDYGEFAYNFYYPKNKVMGLTSYQKSKISDEELFKKYDVLQVAEDEFIVKDPAKLQKETKKQLTDIWNKANKN